MRAFATALLAAVVPAMAAQPDAAPDTTELDTVVVIGSRAPEPLRQVVGSVSVVEHDELERAGVIDIADLARLVPGLAVPGDAARFGRLGFNLRGLEGNRVSIEIDGVPLPDTFSVGQFALAGRDLADMQAIQRVEVLRGPASTLYGSKALAGVVAYTTRSPEDFLWDRGALTSGLRLGYTGRDDSRLIGGHLAATNGSWSGLLLVGRRQGHETENNPASGGMPANPADVRRDTALAKLEYDAQAAGTWTFTLDHALGEQQTDVQSLVAGPGRYATTTALDADDRWQRNRVSLAGAWQQPFAWLDSLDLLLYGQRSATTQLTDQYRDADAQTPYPTLRARRFDLDQDSHGLELVAQSRGEWLGLDHWHVYGIDLAWHDYQSLRDGRQVNLDTGASTNVVLGEDFPVRDFPDSRVREAGLFWQDEIRLTPQWAIVPGVRGERYRMDAHADGIWLADNPDTPIANVSSTRWTPKLGLRYSPDSDTTFYLQAVSGYRAPPFSDVNIGLYLPTFNYQVRPNPDLKPETSFGVEAGWRHTAGEWQASFAIYDNRFRDLIESRANLGVDPATGTLVFQSVNRERAHIQGAELELRWRADPGRGTLHGWFGEVIASASHGDDTARHQPLNSIQPARATLAVGFERDPRWGARFALTGVARKSRVDQTAGPLYAPGGYAVLDGNLWWQPNDTARVNLRLGNLGDRRYYEWASLRGVAPDARDLDLYTQPGRWVGVDLALDW
ncbi:TonB-dependent receptor domain-containing protein [Dokdonella sp.]|uniref:TonB-dependent receptor domain-containing protein n=1 Tax=Dokdonella sp. TaxID=2291710 RepID=UPI0031C77C0B|nr:TonB-dependent receptor [Dokdonella sp.]